MSAQFATRSKMFDWQVAPAEHEIANYDHNKIQYRQHVIDYISPLSKKSLKKKCFFTISTNVLCADIRSSSQDTEPVDKDIYLPLEISITKWALIDGQDGINEDRKLETKFWMINPGSPPIGTRCFALDHNPNHKIEFDKDDQTQNPHLTNDFNFVMKEINSFLSADRVAFSRSLRHVRQDLGCLKWLNQMTNKKSNPIKVYSLEDLYVVLTRHLEPSTDPFVGQGIATFRLSCIDDYNPIYHCPYHQIKAVISEDGTTNNCAKALSYLMSNVLIDDINGFTSLFDK